MEYIFTEKKNIGQIAGLFGAFVAITLGQTAPSHAGIINSTNATNAIGVVAGAVAGASIGGALVGSFAGPPGAAAVSAAAATGVVVSAVTYTVVTHSIRNPTAAAQTIVSLSPVTGPVYMATHPTQMVNAVQNFWNYLFN